MNRTERHGTFPSDVYKDRGLHVKGAVISYLVFVKQLCHSAKFHCKRSFRIDAVRDLSHFPSEQKKSFTSAKNSLTQKNGSRNMFPRLPLELTSLNPTFLAMNLARNR